MKSAELCVGIAGGSCSGKSTLEKNIRAQLENTVSLVSFDDFFVGLKALDGVPVENWDDPKLYRFDEYGDAIKSLRDGEAAQVVPHSSESKAEGIKLRVIKPTPLVVATGFLALYNSKINRFFDAKIFIDVPEDEIIRRRLARAALRPPGLWDSEEYITGMLIPSHRKYIQPQIETADYVINGMLGSSDITSEVLGIINQLKSKN